MSQNVEAEYDEPRQKTGIFDFVGRWFNPDHNDEQDDVVEVPETAQDPVFSRASGGSTTRGRSNITALRIDHTRRTHVTVRRAVHTFEDARRAAEGLKQGQQQIVNLEQTPADMTERITDFMNGATYALGGAVEKIGGQVYLFTPSTVTIDIEDKPAPAARTSYLDRD